MRFNYGDKSRTCKGSVKVRERKALTLNNPVESLKPTLPERVIPFIITAKRFFKAKSYVKGLGAVGGAIGFCIALKSGYEDFKNEWAWAKRLVTGIENFLDTSKSVKSSVGGITQTTINKIGGAYSSTRNISGSIMSGAYSSTKDLCGKAYGASGPIVSGAYSSTKNLCGKAYGVSGSIMSGAYSSTKDLCGKAYGASGSIIRTSWHGILWTIGRGGTVSSREEHADSHEVVEAVIEQPQVTMLLIECDSPDAAEAIIEQPQVTMSDN